MPQFQKKLTFNKLKVLNSPKITSVSIQICYLGKNIQKLYKRNVKNGMVNFFGESCQITLNRQKLVYKIMNCSQTKEKIIAEIKIDCKQLEVSKILNFSSDCQGFVLDWKCTPILSETTSDPFQDSEQQKQIEDQSHHLLSDRMLLRKLKKSYSILTNDSQENQISKVGQSEIVFSKQS